jgi:hypothetical protein
MKMTFAGRLKNYLRLPVSFIFEYHPGKHIKTD